MKPLEAYERFLIKSEKNGTNDGLSTDKGRFKTLYNEHQNRFTEFIYERKNEDDLRQIQTLLVNDKRIEGNRKRNYFLFPLSKNYLDHSSLVVIGSKNNCNTKAFEVLTEIKDMEKDKYLSDSNYKPSFEHRETLYSFTDDDIKVYTSDFNINYILHSYYRYPKQIQLIDESDPESDFLDIDLDFDEKIIDRIISSTVSGLYVNDALESWQLHNLQSKTEL